MDRRYLLLALEEARSRQGFCAPNPAVGAVLVRDGRILGQGHHQGAGHPHAEAEAIAAAGGEVRGATLYVTLEPCCHWGRTPPCTDRILKEGITRVVYGFADPNPVVAGKGEAQLREAGVAVERLPEESLDRFYAPYARAMTTGLPWLTAKIALSLDGRIAGPEGRPVALTGEPLRQYTHQRRLRADGILTTARTVACDDPQLNVRLGEAPVGKPVFVLDREARLSLNARLWQTAAELTLFVGPEADLTRRQELEARGARIVEVPTGADGRLALDPVVRELGKRGLHEVWVEAGGELFGALAEGGWLQSALLYVAPRWLGTTAQSAFAGQAGWLETCRRVSWRQVGADGVCELEW